MNFRSHIFTPECSTFSSKPAFLSILFGQITPAVSQGLCLSGIHLHVSQQKHVHLLNSCLFFAQHGGYELKQLHFFKAHCALRFNILLPSLQFDVNGLKLNWPHAYCMYCIFNFFNNLLLLNSISWSVKKEDSNLNPTWCCLWPASV